MNYKAHIEIMDAIQDRMVLIQSGQIESGQIDMLANDIETLAVTLENVLEKLQEIEGVADKAANTASCLANGIQPD